ncbi:putative quinol monooxygenase [Streptacidiphilus fuscans]|uniref:Antibiotic biosynthesis monooxygenase n=1 Tax=Streptacidiphilus fuscans TaxID=2789292 RepID=A0A931BC87_9ACTN|nr:putative quinol monooxygenase [Streptacidiphilus fuscans]MBF9070770.1 antibiotic biosynthesis monooxygenase [Streptacidiphilus fuscans]
MITCTTVLNVNEGSEEPFEKLLGELVANVLANEPGTPLFQFVRSLTVPRRYLVVEQYVDEEALARHSATEYLKVFVPAMLPLLAADPELHSYVPVPAGDPTRKTTDNQDRGLT